MSTLDVAKDAAQKLTDQAKEKTGKATDNKDLPAEGQTDQAQGDLTNAGENIKDASDQGLRQHPPPTMEKEYFDDEPPTTRRTWSAAPRSTPTATRSVRSTWMRTPASRCGSLSPPDCSAPRKASLPSTARPGTETTCAWPSRRTSSRTRRTSTTTARPRGQNQALYSHYANYLRTSSSAGYDQTRNTDSTGQHDADYAEAGRDNQDGAAALRDTGTVGRDTSGPNTDKAMTRSEERLHVGIETVQTGRARLRKYIVTENVTQTVPVSHEEVRLEREPITDANRDHALSGADLSEEEHEVTLHAERPVVQKETVPVERVRLDTETVTEQQQVSDEVRKERIDGVDVDADAGTGTSPR